MNVSSFSHCKNLFTFLDISPCSESSKMADSNGRYAMYDVTASDLHIFFFSIPGALEDENVIDFTSAIDLPLPTGVNWVEGPNGLDGEPAFQFAGDTNVVRPAKSVLPLSFPSDFAITVTVRPGNDRGGVLFSVTSEDNSAVYLGLELLPVRRSGEFDGQATIRFIYLNPYFENNETISFPVNEFTNRWSRFALRKKGNTISLYFACGANVEHKVAQKTWGAFIIPGTSLFYIGRAGKNANYNVFEVSMMCDSIFGLHFWMQVLVLTTHLCSCTIVPVNKFVLIIVV